MKSSSFIGFSLYFFLTIFFLNKFRKDLSIQQSIFAIILGLCFFQLPPRILNFSSSLISLLDFILHFFGIICGYLYITFGQKVKYLVVTLAFGIAIFVFLQGYDYYNHKLNYGTFTGEIYESNLPTTFEAFDKQKNSINDNNFNGRIVLLDFWNTRCGICFEKFPQVQTIYNKYENDSSVLILAVNKPLAEVDAPDEAFLIVKKKEFTFPVVISEDEDLAEKFGVSVYPTTFVINQNKQIVYKGDIEGAVKMVDKLKSNAP